MPINKPNQQYLDTQDKVTRVIDCFNGQDAVKSKETTYLPKLGGQTALEYKAYLNRGYVMPVVKQAAAALTGAIMRKDPVVELNAQLEYLEEDSNGNGRTLFQLAFLISKGLLVTGRHGLLIDPLDEGVAIKPYSRLSIINWHPNYIVLAQEYTVLDKKDKFTQSTMMEFLELTFDENGLYIQNKWRDDGKAYSITETLEPSINGNRLDYLPFVFCNTIDSDEDLTDPALLSLADVNLDQYRLSTDLRHGLHWTALPTMFIFGELVDSKGKPAGISVGSGSSNNIADTEARAELLEFTGAGLGAISNAINDNVTTMATIGASMLEDKSAGVKATETVRMEKGSESASLLTIAQSIEGAINQALKIISEWSNISDESTIVINKDFVDSTIDPSAVTAFLQAYMTGAITLNTFLNLLQKNELLPKGITAEDEEDRLDSGTQFQTIDNTNA